MRKCMAEKHGAPFCGRNATHHLLVAGGYQSFTCDQHLRAAVRKVQAIDQHAYREGPCDIPKSEGGHWQNSSLEREGWCWVDDDGMNVESALELVGAEPNNNSKLTEATR